MPLFEAAFQELRQEITDDLERRLLERLEPRIEQALYSRHMTVEECARYLRIHSKTLRRMIDNDEIPSFRIRSKIFLRLEDVDKWIEARLERRPVGEGTAEDDA